MNKLATCLATLAALSAHLCAQITNPSFEAGLAGWTVTAGSNATTTSTADSLFPGHGSNYLVVVAANGPGTPGHGPHGSTVSQIYQNFVMPAGASPSIMVSWEFLNTEGSNQATWNDFMSIDLLDATGSTLIANIVFCDTGTLGGTPAYTNVPGAGGLAGALVTWVPNQATALSSSLNPAPAGIKHAFRDLTGLVTAGTSYRLAISVGNGGDNSFNSIAYIDSVWLNVAQRNTGAADMRILGSSHTDGLSVTTDSGGRLPDTPYEFATAPGQRVAIRAYSDFEGTPWILGGGTLKRVGTPVPNLGTLNLDLAQPLYLYINGFTPGNFIEAMLGTISFNTNFIEAQIAAGVPVGTEFTLQAAMGNPTVAGGATLSAATNVRVGAPQIPMASTLVPGGANSDDSFSLVSLATMGPFTFYGTNYTELYAGSNGFITFGSGSTTLSESVASMLSTQPRIAICWDDLNPAPAGAGVFDSQTSDTYTLTWANVPEFSNQIFGNNMTIQLYDNGVITLYYGSTTMDDGLVGISPGNAIATASGISDFSASSTYGGAAATVSATQGAFQRFNALEGTSFFDKFDVRTLCNGRGAARITFAPTAAGGYRVFTGTR